MDENMEAVTAVDTIPAETAESTEETALSADTTVDTQSQQETAKGGEGTTPPPNPDDAAAQPTEEVKPITVPIQFNHEDREIPLDEAATIIQKSLKDEPILQKLQVLAAGCNKSMDEMVNMLVEANDQMLRSRFLEETGGNERAADILLEDARRQRQSAFDSRKQAEAQEAENNRQQESDRLATEFIELQKECPEYEKFSDLPKAIVQMASAKKITLCEAALRYERAERKKIEQNQQQQAAASAATTGSRASTSDDGEDPLIAAMMAGVNAAL